MEPWSDRARNRVAAWQERSWGQIALELGLGWQPRAAYLQLNSGLPSEEFLAAERFIATLDPSMVERLRAGEGLADVEGVRRGDAEILESFKKRYFVDPPTEYEDPCLHSVAVAHLDGLLPVLLNMPYELPANPRVATVPTRSVHAWTRVVPGTDEAVMFFQHGLMLFLRQYSVALGLAVPFDWLDLPALSEPIQGGRDEAENATNAADVLAASLTAFVVEGNPRAADVPSPRGSSLVTAIVLMRYMELFVLSHELMHLLLRHPPRPLHAPTHLLQQEFDADDVGFSVAARVAEDEGAGLAIGGWSADLALGAFDLIERCVAYLSTERTDAPPSETLPLTTRRRQELLWAKPRELAGQDRVSDAARLKKLTVSGARLIEKLWLATRPTLDQLRRRGIQPSPIWGRPPLQTGSGRGPNG
jgi:hypothetical protein